MNNELQTAQQKAWIAVVSRAHVMRGVEGGFAQLCHGKRSPLAREVPIATLMDKLEFIATSPNWGMVMRRGHFAISAADFQTIRNAMLPTHE